MIRKYKIPLKAENGRLRPEHAYALYGELMSRIDGGVADELHTDGFTPISQHLESGINGAEADRLTGLKVKSLRFSRMGRL